MTLEIKGFASVYNVLDSHNHVVIPGACYWRNHEPAMLLDHEGDQVGAWQRVTETMHGLFVEGVVYDRPTIGAILRRRLVGLSIGFVMETVRIMEFKRRRVIASARVQEVSLTERPSNEHCVIERVRLRGAKEWTHYQKPPANGSRMKSPSLSAKTSIEESTRS